jgi:protein-S-isoprenylcysteine O-methyltransferase Ste14
MKPDSGASFRNALSLAAFVIAVAMLVFLVFRHHLLASSPPLLALQVGSVLLMIWARVTFGRRSFHASADTSDGGLVTTGPYRYWRHPIYASIIYFVWAGQFPSPSVPSVAAAAIATAALVARMLLEEHFLRAAYPGYPAYCKRARRLIPFLF